MRILNNEIEVSCPKCEAQLAVENRDVQRSNINNLLYCTCPLCYQRIYIQESIVPKHWDIDD